MKVHDGIPLTVSVLQSPALSQERQQSSELSEFPLELEPCARKHGNRVGNRLKWSHHAKLESSSHSQVSTSKDGRDPRKEIQLYARPQLPCAFFSKFTFLGVVLIVGVIGLLF